jgi:ribosomal protein S27E
VKFPSLFAALGRAIERETAKRRGRVECPGCGALVLWSHAATAKSCPLCGEKLPSITIQGGKAA